MDKWDKLTGALFVSIKENNPVTGAIAGLAIVAEILRTVEDIAESFNRIASAMEKK